MKAKTMRKIASWNAKLFENTFPTENKTFTNYRFIEGRGWVVVSKGKVK